MAKETASLKRQASAAAAADEPASKRGKTEQES